MATATAPWGWTGSNYHELAELEVWYIRNDINNNRSRFGYKIGNNSNNSYGDTGTLKWTLKDQWATRTTGSKGNTPTTGYNQKRTYSSGEFWINHNSDGTLLNISFVLSITRTAGNVRSTTVRVTLSNIPTIPRASQITSVTNFTLPNGNPSYTIQSHSSAFRHIVDLRVDNITIASMRDLSVGDHRFNLTKAQQDKITNMMKTVTSKEFTLVMSTWNSDKKIGVNTSAKGTVSLSSTLVPTIESVTIKDTNTEIFEKFDAFIQGYSQLNVKTVAKGTDGSTVKNITARIDMVNYSGANITTGTIYGYGSLPLTVTVTDTRNRKATYKTTLTVHGTYPPAVVNSFEITRIPNRDSEFAQIKIDASIPPIGNKNGFSVTVESRPLDKSSDWETVYHEPYSQNYKYIKTIRTDQYTAAEKDKYKYNFSAHNSYDIRLVIRDELTDVVKLSSVQSAFTLLDFRANGLGLGVGKHSEMDAFEVGMPTFLHKYLTIRFESDKPTTNWFMQFKRKNNTLQSGFAYDEESNYLKLHLYDKDGLWKSQFIFDPDGDFYVKGKAVLIDDSVTASISLKNGFKPYGDNLANQPSYTHRNGVVGVSGVLNPPENNNLGQNSPTVIGNIPVNYAPVRDQVQICQGSGTSLWTIRVRINGEVTAERYRNANGTLRNPSSSEWMPFSVTYVI